MSKEALLSALAPLLQALPGLVDRPPAQARAELERLFPLSSLQELKALVRRGVEERWLCDKEAPRPAGGPEDAVVRFSRVLKATDPQSFSVDAVHMGGEGAGHLHPGGEFDLCFAVSGAPRFDGQPEGWTVYGKGTWHVPTVSGGVMDILYFLPGGQMVFGPDPAAPRP